MMIRPPAAGSIRVPSAEPPGSLRIENVPQFIAFGFDDNGYSGLADPQSPGGVAWISETFTARTNPQGSGSAATFDGARCGATFFITGGLAGNSPFGESPELVMKAWGDAGKAGFEMANHTHTHPHGRLMTEVEWTAEMLGCRDDLAETGFNDAVGFRTPYLEYNEATYAAIEACGFRYDASIEEGWQKDQDGSNFLWPYTLDHGSPGHEYLLSKGRLPGLGSLTPRRGLWELPIHTLIVPPDGQCEAYGIKKGLRSELAVRRPYFDPSDGKISGLDWNLFVDFGMSAQEFLATMKYSLDLRLGGNHCPLLFGAHGDIYCRDYEKLSRTVWRERQDALLEFLDYALTWDVVRVRPYRDILGWLEDPVGLGK